MYNPTLGRFLTRDPIGEKGGTNIYEYVGNDPINGNDPTGLYQEGGHFYTTYMVAIAAGLDKNRAFNLAYFSQLPDEVSEYDALSESVNSGLRDAWGRDIQTLLHSLHGGPAAPRREILQGLVQKHVLNSNEDWRSGLLIHALADSYAHARLIDTRSHVGLLYFPSLPFLFLSRPNYIEFAYAPPEGHLADGRAPDKIGNDPSKYKEYVMALYVALGGDLMTANSNPKLQALINIANDLSGMSNDQENVLLAHLAASKAYGYDRIYSPIGGNQIDSALGKLNRTAVQSVMDEIRTACCPPKKT